jgi:elongation of very long chain fatty acids protein 4
MSKVSEPSSVSSGFSKIPCAEATTTTDNLTISLWKPLALSCLYVVFLRSWYLESKVTPSENQTFGENVSWVVPTLASIGYLTVIFALKHFMANRKPYNLKDYMFTYNLYQTILNIWCVIAFVKELYTQGMSVWGNQIDSSPNGLRMGFLIWVHYNNKYVELLDTLFMALRKKDNQISFLHMYHHVLLIWAWFLVCKFGCGGDAYFGALANSFVHVVMYGYYLLALLKIDTPWKKWLTSIQMAQFAICFSHCMYVLYVDCYPRWLTMVEVWVMTNMLVLFGNFYRKTYSKKANEAPKSE